MKKTIAISSPSSMLTTENFNYSFNLLKEKFSDKINFIIGDSCFTELTPLKKAEELKELSKISDFILCARGGCGSFHLYEYLDDTIKPIIGYSDISSLLLWQSIKGINSYHGPMLLDIINDIKSFEFLFVLLHSDNLTKIEYPKKMNSLCLYPGAVNGKILASNLSLFCTVLNSFNKAEIFSDSIIFFEDIKESVDSIERYLWTISCLPESYFAKAFVFSAFTETSKGSNNYRLTDVLRKFSEKMEKPCFIGFPAYHGPFFKYSLPLGKKVHINADMGEVQLL